VNPDTEKLNLPDIPAFFKRESMTKGISGCPVKALGHDKSTKTLRSLFLPLKGREFFGNATFLPDNAEKKGKRKKA